jgi:hypothetical protein
VKIRRVETIQQPALLVALGAVAVFCCGTLPEYAAPKGELLDPSALDSSDAVPYRMLVREDFKGKNPPPSFAPYADKIGAATCGQILTANDMNISVKQVRSNSGDVVYQVVPHHIRFEARMDRNCSWWNPEDLGVPEDYILEHEQIHFALFELEARRLNADIDDIKGRIAVTVRKLEDAQPLAQRELEQYIQQRMGAILARSHQFDEETSLGYKPVQQKKWWNLVNRELAATSN